ncbi:MAG: DUF4115 domain-containing protein [Syntrophaceae bacterium]
MPTVSVRIDSQSKYTIEFDAEYSPEEFTETIKKHIKFVNEIASGREKINLPESPAAQGPGPDNDSPRKQTFEKSPAPQKAASSPGPGIILARTLLAMAVILAFACGIAAVCLWQTDLGMLTTDKAMPPPAFKAKISTTPDPGGKAESNPGAVPAMSGTPAVKQGPPPLPDLNKIAIYARQPAWMRIAEDNNPPYEVMLQPGDKLEREAAKFRVKIGNARGVAVLFNNKQISLTGSGSNRLRGNVVSLKLPGE